MALVILVVLASIVYALSARIATANHRRQYLVDYQKARYAADSAMKYALINFKKASPRLINRNNSPDFSDLFTLSRLEYQQMLEEWAQQQYEKALLEQQENGESTEKDDETKSSLASLFGLLGLDPNSSEDFSGSEEEDDLYIDPNDLEIPGLYGPKWPLVAEPIEFNIDQTKITIELEDENAKMPLTWAITTDKEVNRQAQAALQTFSEWMQMDSSQMEKLALQLDDIGEIKQFKLDPKDIIETKTTRKTAAARRTASRKRRRTASRARTTTKKTLVRTAIHHTTDFAKLLHSSMLDLDTLAIPIDDTGKRYEAPIKYLALWGSQRVNINTAPRHVLEAAFTFGGDAEEIADEIIRIRQGKPIKDLKDLKSKLYGYNDSIEKSKDYITTTSRFFSIKVTAQSGRAKTASIATVIKEGNRFERIAIITR
jgi:type II secretory pathway component PulK